MTFISNFPFEKLVGEGEVKLVIMSSGEVPSPSFKMGENVYHCEKASFFHTKEGVCIWTLTGFGTSFGPPMTLKHLPIKGSIWMIYNNFTPRDHFKFLSDLEEVNRRDITITSNVPHRGDDVVSGISIRSLSVNEYIPVEYKD